jgi:hypothetical protein
MIKTWLTLVLVIATATPAAAVAAAKSATPEARVQAFIADYFRVHGQGRNFTFHQWNAAAARLEKVHFVGGGERGLSQLMPGEPEYRPGDEILHTSSGGTTRIETRAPAGALARYHEFELREVRGDWRIVRIRHYFKGGDDLFVTPDQRPRFETPATSAWGTPIDRNDSETFNFRDGQDIYTYNAIGTVEVRRVGTLNMTSGNLVVGNLGYSAYYLSPIDQRIAPGQYPVEVAIGFKSVAAVRVVVSKEPVVTWHAAKLVSNPGAGLLFENTLMTITDATSVLTANGRHVEQIVEELSEPTAIANVQMSTLVNANDAVTWTTWFGDAGHRVFWGADASGKPAVMLVNFSLDDTMDIE